MPVTSRHAVHDGKRGLSACLSYILNDEKTDNGLLSTGINCTVNFATEEFLMIHDKFHAPMNDSDRVAYHAYQSFSPLDNITPEQVHEIGVQLCKELYPEFQCIVTTHIDKGHLHNHIVINSINLNGNKLVDRLAHPSEGLYGLRDASDRIAMKYGCKIIENPPKIGRYKAKNYVYEIASSNWRTQIKTDIDHLKEECNSFDELLERLSLEGYIIKRGSYISVKPYGMKRFARLATIDDKYSEQSLRDFFTMKKRQSISEHFLNYNVYPNNDLSLVCDREANISKTAIIKSESALCIDKTYPKYFNTRYQEFKLYHELVNSINLMNEYKIYSYEDLMQHLETLESEIEHEKYEYNKLKSENNTLQARLPVAKLYLQYYNHYKMYEEQKLYSPNLKETDEVKLFLSAKEELMNATLDEVREIVNESSKLIMKTNKQYAHLSYLKSQATDLNKIKKLSVEKCKHYIKSFKFSAKMIKIDQCTDEKKCIRLPYTKLHIFVPQDSIVWNNYDVSATAYLIDDEEYDVYNEENQKVDSVRGDNIHQIIDKEKEKVTSSHLKI